VILIQQDVTGTAQNLPKDDDVMDTGQMGDCVSIIILWNKNLGTYRNVRGYHGGGGLGNINTKSLFADVPDGSGTLIIVCFGHLAHAKSGSSDLASAEKLLAEHFPKSTVKLRQDGSHFQVTRTGKCTPIVMGQSSGKCDVM
jgi:hypothetical protein